MAITGPRQSGKTTLVRAMFGDRPFVSLEDLDERSFATDDPRGFLARFPDGAVLDEVQRAVVGKRPALAAAFGGLARFAAALLVRLAKLASGLLVGFGLAGGRRVDPGRGDLDRQGDDIDRGLRHLADDAAGQEGAGGS